MFVTSRQNYQSLFPEDVAADPPGGYLQMNPRELRRGSFELRERLEGFEDRK